MKHPRTIVALIELANAEHAALGKLTDATYAELAARGWGREYIDGYLSGFHFSESSAPDAHWTYTRPPGTGTDHVDGFTVGWNYHRASLQDANASA